MIKSDPLQHTDVVTSLSCSAMFPLMYSGCVDGHVRVLNPDAPYSIPKYDGGMNDVIGSLISSYEEQNKEEGIKSD